jgi:hypothetical protein
VLPLVPPAGSARWQRPFLHRVLRGAFPGCDGTRALCDSLGPWHHPRLPSRGATRRWVCSCAPSGPGHPTGGQGFVLRSPYRIRTSPGDRQGLPSSRETPLPLRPGSSTPAGRHTPHPNGVAAWPPLRERRRLPHGDFRSSIAWLFGSLSTLRRVSCLTPVRTTHFQVRVRLSWAGLVTRRVSPKGFRQPSSSFPELYLARSHSPAAPAPPRCPAAARCRPCGP